jgi:hypothetical protein
MRLKRREGIDDGREKKPRDSYLALRNVYDNLHNPLILFPLAASPPSTKIRPTLAFSMSYSPSPPHSRASSSGSATSLRALELSQGAQRVPTTPTRRPRNLSITTISTVFDFQRDLLPISLSEAARDGEPVAEKTIGLVNGMFNPCFLLVRSQCSL